MAPALGVIPAILKEARQRKGLSQHALAEKIGVPQSHISKIENGNVDLQTSSLIQFARAVDLEVHLVPRSLLPAVHAIERNAAPQLSAQFRSNLQKYLDRVRDQVERLKAARGELRYLRSIGAVVGEIRKLPLDASDAAKLQHVLSRFAVKLTNMEKENVPQRIVETNLQQLYRGLSLVRNIAAQKVVDAPQAQVPAYQLEDDDDA